MELKDIKTKAIEECKSILEKQLENAKGNLQNIESSAGEETKSAMGDKYETSTEMLHQERSKALAQVNELQQKLATLAALPMSPSETIRLGSLVKTSNALYFISISQGFIDVGTDKVIFLSPATPIGKLLIGKKRGDSFVFNGKASEILDVV